MAEQEEHDLTWLEEKGKLQERPFTSSVPVLGPLIVWFRSAWNSVAAKWLIRPIIHQQSEFNTLVVRQIDSFEEQVGAQVIAQDQEQTALFRQLGELSLQVGYMNHLLESIDRRLARLENESDTGRGEEEE